MHCCLCAVLIYEGIVGEWLLPRELRFAKVLGSAASCTDKLCAELLRQLGPSVKVKLCCMGLILKEYWKIEW